jgi:mycoredoxin
MTQRVHLYFEDGSTQSILRLQAKSLEYYTLNDLYTMQPSQIVMYTTEYCSDCRRAKAFFEANGIGYLRVGIEGNEEATNFIIKINNGYRSVPTIIFPDGAILTEPGWEELRVKIFGT